MLKKRRDKVEKDKNWHLTSFSAVHIQINRIESKKKARHVNNCGDVLWPAYNEGTEKIEKYEAAIAVLVIGFAQIVTGRNTPSECQYIVPRSLQRAQRNLTHCVEFRVINVAVR